SKYIHYKSLQTACYHLAYIPLLSALVQDTYNKVYKQSASLELLTHLKYKLFQAVLSYILLQPEILKAYSSSILFNYLDGKLCRLFLRFAFYLADYSKKYVL
ncbi:uncharacterized protein FOMMEDRAFT_34070, partial [Fomitiporia mediterranea MF3/22]|uniref:uncharacterized protein n=1 Tax=Fomitiporia mediterranea (strain MF3/22) TaxID=694068 RepID=UPI00044093D5